MGQDYQSDLTLGFCWVGASMEQTYPTMTAHL